MITCLQSHHQSSSCVLYTLQWSKGRPWQTNQKRIAVIKTTHDESGDNLLHHIVIYMTLQLSGPSDVVEACADEFVNVHRQLPVWQNTEDTNNTNRVYDS